AAVDADEVLARLVYVALPAAQRSRRPVLSAQLVEDRAVDARPRELLERRALLGVVPLDRMDQRLQAARDEVLYLAARRDLADLLVDDVLHHRGEGEDEPVTHSPVAALLVLAPQRQRILRRDAGTTRGVELHCRGAFL